MRVWALLLLVAAACGDSHDRKPDAGVEVDAPLVDAPVDAREIDAPPDAPLHPLDCEGALETVVDVGADRQLNSFVVLGDVIYYSSSIHNSDGSRVDAEVDALDLVTRLPAMEPLDVGLPWVLQTTADSVWAPAISKVWRLQNGVAPVAVVTARGDVEVATADDSYVYWAERDPNAAPEMDDSTVWRQLIAGGAAQSLGTCDVPFAMHVTDTTLYCSDFWHGELKYGPKDGTLSNFADGVGTTYPMYGAVRYGNDLFYFDTRPGQQLFQVSLTTNQVQQVGLADLQNHLEGMVVTDDFIYFAAYPPSRFNRHTSTFEAIAFPPMTAADQNPVIWGGGLMFAIQDYNRGGDRYVVRCAE